MAHTSGEQQALVQQCERVAHGKARQARGTGAQRVGQVTAVQRSAAERWQVGGHRAIQVGGQRVARVHGVGVLLLKVEQRCTGHPFVPHAAGLQLAAHAQLAGVDAVLARVVKAVGGGSARAAVVDGDIGQRVGFFAAARASGGPGGHVLRDVPLATEGAEGVALVRVAPGLGVVALVVGHCGHAGHIGAQRHVGAGALELVVLPADVARQAHIAAAPVQPHGQQAQFGVFVVDGGAAAVGGRVQAHTGAAIRPKAAGNVCRQLGAAAAAHAKAHAVQGLVGCALGQQVDAAANAAACGAGTVQEGRCTAQHFHALKQLGGDVLAGQQAVQAVERGVVRVEQEAADEVRLLEVAKATRHAHGGVVLQHIAHAAGVAVQDQFVGVADGGERRVHRIARAQNARTRAARHLAAGVGGRQALGRCVGTGVDGDGGQGLALARRGGGCGGLCMQRGCGQGQHHRGRSQCNGGGRQRRAQQWGGAG